MVFWGFDETTFKQYIIVGNMQKETVRSSKLRILTPFGIRDGDFRKNPVGCLRGVPPSNLSDIQRWEKSRFEQVMTLSVVTQFV